jgi:hypothetical protein
MTKMLLLSTLCLTLAALGHSFASTGAGEPTSRDTETRFAIKFCTAQYSSQRDVDACLARYLPATPAS